MTGLRPLSVALVFTTPRFTRYVKKKNACQSWLAFIAQSTRNWCMGSLNLEVPLRIQRSSSTCWRYAQYVFGTPFHTGRLQPTTWRICTFVSATNMFSDRNKHCAVHAPTRGYQRIHAIHPRANVPTGERRESLQIFQQHFGRHQREMETSKLKRKRKMRKTKAQNGTRAKGGIEPLGLTSSPTDLKSALQNHWRSFTQPTHKEYSVPARFTFM